MRRIAFTAALLLSGGAGAQTLYKCVSHAGTSYQQAPCAAGARTVRTIETEAEPPPTSQQLAERATKSREDRLESEYLSHLAGTDAPRVNRQRQGYRDRGRNMHRDPPRDRCEAAKAQREERLRDAGLNRTFDMLRRLDEKVSDACDHRV